MSPHHVVALAMPGVVAFDLSIVAQVFGHHSEPEYTFQLASPVPGAVQTSTGFQLAGAAGLEALGGADTVVVPGYHGHPPPSQEVVDAVRDAASRGARIASVCTGAFVLAAAGLLDGRRATTHWQQTAELQQRHPQVLVDPDVLYVDHGQLATSAGVAAGIDLCLHLVRRDHGEALAARIARRMVVAPHRDGGQAQFIRREGVAAPDLLGGLGLWVQHHLADDLSTARLARQAGLSERQLARRVVAETGVTPLQWVTHQRVLEARRLLETSDLPLAVVAARSGLGTATNLRRHIRDQLGTTPSAYRRQFGRVAGE